jgi:hypothetical protein
MREPLTPEESQLLASKRDFVQKVGQQLLYSPGHKIQSPKSIEHKVCAREDIEFYIYTQLLNVFSRFLSAGQGGMVGE